MTLLGRISEEVEALPAFYGGVPLDDTSMSNSSSASDDSDYITGSHCYNNRRITVCGYGGELSPKTTKPKISRSYYNDNFKNENNKRRHHYRNGEYTIGWKQILIGFSFVFLCVLTLYYRFKCDNVYEELSIELQEILFEQKEIRYHEKRRSMKRERAWRDQVYALQAATQRASRQSVIEKFGPGPHYVELTVEHENLPNGEGNFVFEMAPIDLMPHSVHIFLEQVDHGLWNQASFYASGPHVFQAGPIPNDEELQAAIASDESYEEKNIALRPFRELNLDSLAFQEYSSSYPHLPWTVGFTGRPAGPYFYINTIDNSAAHGPGGQEHYDLNELADPCFARVYSGFDTLEIVKNTESRDPKEGGFLLDEPIRIKKARVLQKSPSLLQGSDEDDEDHDDNDKDDKENHDSTTRRASRVKSLAKSKKLPPFVQKHLQQQLPILQEKNETADSNMQMLAERLALLQKQPNKSEKSKASVTEDVFDEVGPRSNSIFWR